MKQKITPYQALLQAVDAAGSLAALARLCGVSTTAVWKWVQSAKRISPEYVLRVEDATGISRHLLRPDIYPPEIRRALTSSQIGEPFYECGPILSVRAQARNGNRGGVLANGGAA
jgi:DNA-binding transcriptional regulator YdaS (Cro superfamily)